MAKALFHLVDQIRAAEKYCDASRDDIRRMLIPAGKCHLPVEVDVLDGNETLTVELKLNINTKSEMALAWTMSIKLHDWLIDCLDYEEKYRTHDGEIGRGWHRHGWDPNDETAKHLKIPASEVGDISTHDDFLLRGFSVFRLRVNAVSHGQPDLQFT